MHDEHIIDYAEVWKGEDGLWYLRTKSDNGATIMWSEGYENMGYALNLAAEAAPAVKLLRQIDDEEAFETFKSDDVLAMSDKAKTKLEGDINA